MLNLREMVSYMTAQNQTTRTQSQSDVQTDKIQHKSKQHEYL